MRLRLADLAALCSDPSGEVTSHEAVLRGNRLNPEGIYSERIFGRLDGDSAPFSCPCGGLRGRFNRGGSCGACGGEVAPTDPSVRRSGWVGLGGYLVVNPNVWRALHRLAPRRLAAAAGFSVTLDKAGEALPPPEAADRGEWDNAGLAAVAADFPGFVAYLRSHSRLEPAQADALAALALRAHGEGKALVGRVPVFSSALRPAVMVGDTFVHDEINNVLNLLTAAAGQLRDASDEERTELFVLPLLAQCQAYTNELFDRTLHKVKGKGGYVRNNLLSNRLNFSCRSVIVPLPPGHSPDELVLPYLAGMELYRFHLVNLIDASTGCGLAAADRRWQAALSDPDPGVTALLRELVAKTEGGLQVLFNRNPTINLGSILLMRVAGFREDPSDFTCGIHNLVLRLLAADYDGDTLNVIPLFDRRAVSAFSALRPSAMILDRNDGGFRQAMSLDKDAALGISTALRRGAGKRGG